MIALNIICVCSVLVSCVFMLAVGIFIGSRCNVFKRQIQEPLTEQEKNAQRKAERELKNFWTYDGNSQRKSD